MLVLSNHIFLADEGSVQLTLVLLCIYQEIAPLTNETNTPGRKERLPPSH